MTSLSEEKSDGETGLARVSTRVDRGDVLRTFDHGPPVTACALKGDGSIVLSGDHDGAVKVWDAQMGSELATLAGHDGPVRACAIDPNGSFIVSGGDDATLRLWDARTGSELRTLAGHDGPVRACAIDPNGSFIVSGGDDGTVRLWDARTGSKLRTLAGHDGPVRACAIDPNGSFIVSGGDDGTLRLWDARTGSKLRGLAGHDSPVRACAVSDDGSLVVAGDQNGAVTVWDPQTGAERHSFSGRGRPVRTCAVSADESLVVAGDHDGTVMVWDARTGSELRGLPGHGAPARASAIVSGGFLVVSGGEHGRVWLASATPQTDGASLARALAAFEETSVSEWQWNSVAQYREALAISRELVTLPREIAQLDAAAAAARERAERLRRQDVVDPVDCTVFAPPRVPQGQEFLVQVFAHIPEQAKEAEKRAKKVDPAARWRNFKSLEAVVPRESRLTFELSMRGLEVEEPLQSLIWNGDPRAVEFAVHVPTDRAPGTATGKVTALLDSCPVGYIGFQVEVTSQQVEDVARERQPTGDGQRHSMAFVSYASEDRGKVLERVQILKLLGVPFFQDVLDLDPGDRWRKKLYSHIDKSDLFLLFWSENAKRSKWVRKESRRALARKLAGGDPNRVRRMPILRYRALRDLDDLAPPDIRPVILEGPPVPTPWREFSEMQFDDPLIHVLASSGSEPGRTSASDGD
jgi:hypothetical protein